MVLVTSNLRVVGRHSGSEFPLAVADVAGPVTGRVPEVRRDQLPTSPADGVLVL